MALRAYLREKSWFADHSIEEPNLAQFLDIVAVGTVADVANLDYNNRILVEQGLRRIRAAKCCAGIRALLTVAGRNLLRISSTDLGFVIGPRLNAAGRLEDMSLGIECLLTNDELRAIELAKQLNDLNEERKQIEQENAGSGSKCIEIKKNLMMWMNIAMESQCMTLIGIKV